MVPAHPAKWWQPAPNGKLLCTLCPRYCTVGEGQHGFCYIRQNHAGSMVSVGYGRPTGFGLDPIEKKPLNHFFPGTTVLSFGTAGCNLGCKFCQNWSISKAESDGAGSPYCPPEEVVAIALRSGAPSIAFTYNDPVIFGEYVIDTARCARQAGITTVMVTAGYIDERAREEVFAGIDAANVDLKAYSETFYRSLTFSRLQPVLDTLRWLKHNTSTWLEITTLLIPGENDSPAETEKMCGWLLENLGADVPLHFTAFHPDFKMAGRHRTPDATVLRARDIARKAGIRYCYVGNIRHTEGQSTACSGCGTLLIERGWHTVVRNNLRNGCCPACGVPLPGRF